MIITALIIMSAIAIALQTKPAKAAGSPNMFVTPASQSVTVTLPSTPPITKYNISVMVENLPQIMTIACSIKTNDTTDVNITNYYRGSDFNTLGFSIFTIFYWDKPNSDLQDLTAATLTPTDITTPVEIFKVEIAIKAFDPHPHIVDIYAQYAGDIDNNALLIGDCPNDHTVYIINAITTNSIVVDSTTYNVTTLSNSTQHGMTLDQYVKSLNFTVSGADGTNGYINVTIPKVLLDCPANISAWIVMFDNTDYTAQAQINENATHTFIYISYSQSTHEVRIIGTYVVPEFPSVTILVTLLATIAIALALIRKVHKKPWQTL